MFFFSQLAVGLVFFLGAMENDHIYEDFLFEKPTEQHIYEDFLFEKPTKKQKTPDISDQKEIERLVQWKKKVAEIDKKSEEYSEPYAARFEQSLNVSADRPTLIKFTAELYNYKQKFNMFIKHFEPALEDKKILSDNSPVNVELSLAKKKKVQFDDFVRVKDALLMFRRIRQSSECFDIKKIYPLQEVSLSFTEFMTRIAAFSHARKEPLAQAFSFIWDKGYGQLSEIFNQAPQFKRMFFCKLIDTWHILEKTSSYQNADSLALISQELVDSIRIEWKRWNDYINNRSILEEPSTEELELGHIQKFLSFFGTLTESFVDFNSFYAQLAHSFEISSDYVHLMTVYGDAYQNRSSAAQSELFLMLAFHEKFYRMLQFDAQDAKLYKQMNYMAYKHQYALYQSGFPFDVIPAKKNQLQCKLRQSVIMPLYTSTREVCRSLKVHDLTYCWLNYKLLQLSKAYWQELQICNSLSYKEVLETKKEELKRDAYAVNAHLSNLEAEMAFSYPESIGYNTL